MSTIALFGNRHQAEHIDRISCLLSALNRDKATRIVAAPRFLNYLQTLPIELPEISETESPEGADLVLSIGGDGTFLRTAQWVGDLQIPILGINTGHLGYLADMQIDDPEATATAILANRFKIEQRTLLQVDCQALPIDFETSALNEVALLKTDSGSMIAARTSVNSEILTTYLADGLIVATPTGSTGYNLSAGGPILEPTAANWVISPVAPHSLTMRPLVLADRSVIKVTVESRSGNFLLSLDGRSIALPSGSEITIRKAPFCINVAQRQSHNFADTLRNKLLWGINARN